jgi:hypothetical protein
VDVRSRENDVVDDGVGDGGAKSPLAGVRWGRCARVSTVKNEEAVVVAQVEEVSSPARGCVGGGSGGLVVWVRVTITVGGVVEPVGVRQCAGGLLVGANVGIKVTKECAREGLWKSGVGGENDREGVEILFHLPRTLLGCSGGAVLFGRGVRGNERSDPTRRGVCDGAG